MAVKLDASPARIDLTSRECSKLLGSTIGGLVIMAPIENVRAAVIWWAENFDKAAPTLQQVQRIERAKGGT